MKRIKKAVIVAAGLASRLYPLTLNLPKGLLKIAGETILERSVRLLRENGIKEISIIVGFRRDLIQKALSSNIHYQLNPFFAETNNMGSLWFAKEWVKEDPFFYIHGDIVFSSELLHSFISENYEDAALLVDCGPTDEEAMKVRIENGHFIESNKDIPFNEALGEWVGMAIFKRPRVLFNKVEFLLEQRHFQAYDTLAFTEMPREGSFFSIVPTNGHPWIDVDTESDLEQAKKLFP